MALYAANNISKGIAKYAANGKVRLGGSSATAEGDNELPLLEAFAKELGPSSSTLSRVTTRAAGEINKKTVIDFDPAPNQANEYRNLAQAIDTNKLFVIPNRDTGTARRTHDAARVP